MSYFSPLINPATRNQPDGIAGLYACKTLLNEHRPICTKKYRLTGKYLDGADNPDVWFPIAAGTGSVVYSTRYLTLTSSTGASAANRAVIDQTVFPITANYIAVTCKIGAHVEGAGGVRSIAIGFQSAFSSLQTSNRAIFMKYNDHWHVGVNAANFPLTSLPIDRDLQPGDIVTVVLGRQEGSANIDISRFYVNGQKQMESLLIPGANCYAGIGVFNDADTTDAMSIAIDYFGCDYVP